MLLIGSFSAKSAFKVDKRDNFLCKPALFYLDKETAFKIPYLRYEFKHGLFLFYYYRAL